MFLPRLGIDKKKMSPVAALLVILAVEGILILLLVSKVQFWLGVKFYDDIVVRLSFFV